MALPQPYEAPQLPLPHPEAYEGEPREYARALMQRKEDIEKEIDELKSVLSLHGATSDTALVDPEGYPRGDIDVYAIRHARSALVRLYNDRTEVMRRLAGALESAFQVDPARAAEQTTSQPSSQTATAPSQVSAPATNGHREGDWDTPEAWPERPVARVNSVAPGSPAADAGLAAGDVIYSFSGITAANREGIQAIGPVVSRAEGRPLTLLVLRGSERKMLRLTPRSGWGGRGLLGCHILPV